MAHRLSLAIRVNQKTLGFLPCRRVSSYFQPSESEFVDQPVYPPILDMSRQAIKARKIEAVAEKVTSQPTVEEKLIELNMPKYYGWWACQLYEKKIPYNALPFIQFATRTCLVSEQPMSYASLESAADKYLDKVKGPLCDLILQEFGCSSPRHNSHWQTKSPPTEEDRFSKIFNVQLNRLLTSLLSPHNEHLTSSEVDYEPRLESFWWLGGIEPDKTRRKVRQNNKLCKVDPDEPIDRPMQYHGKPCLTVRHFNPLPPLLDRNSGLSVKGEIPEWSLDPRVLGYKYKHCPSTMTPGFWPGTELQHGYLALLNRGHMIYRDVRLNNMEHQEGLHSQAILHSFAWTLAQASYLGFGPYTELTYPIASQTIITNGRHFSFYTYQMNTCALYFKNSSNTNPYRNVCFASNEMTLFDRVEGDQIKDFNDDVLRKLISFYLVKPTEPTVNLRPYLSPEMYIANVEDAKRRQKVEQVFKHLQSNRPRHFPKEEIFHWEKIYKIDHDTRPMEPKRRFFERRDPCPDLRRLDDYDPPYIPRAIRGKKSRRGRPPVPPTIKL